MKVVYTAPNRAHHFRYALALHQAGILHSFVSGLPRLNPRARLDEIGSRLCHADILQTIYIAGLKLNFPHSISTNLAYFSKIEQDIRCKRFVKGCDIFLFYNGSGLSTCQYAKKNGAITIVEAVNCHVDYQEQLLKEEYELLNIKWKPFHAKEKRRRIEEYEQADYILLPSEFVKNSFLNLGFPASKLLKVPYGFNQLIDIDPKTKGILSQEFTVLYVGSISVRKGLTYLIQAFLKLRHPNKKLILVGPKDEVNGIDTNLLGPNITFTGTLKGDALNAMYKKADVFCLPSIEDGFGLVIGEALSFGIPVITTTNTGAYDIIDEGRQGYIVPIRDSHSIYEKLQLLADDAEMLQTMKSAARDKAHKLDGWDESNRLLISTMYSAINKKENLHY